MTVCPGDVMPTDWPVSDMPSAESAYLIAAYKKARVILEYGSGSSTVIASNMADKVIYSVENDLVWAIKLQERLDSLAVSLPYIHYENIGKVGSYGRPYDDQEWRQYHRYAASIWNETFFEQPDVVLIDGRLREACFTFACLSITKPTTIIFDDYVGRERYHQVEELIRPSATIGRMAEFRLDGPLILTPKHLQFAMKMIGEVTYAGKGIVNYDVARADQAAAEI